MFSASINTIEKEKEIVVRERIEDIRETKYCDWFATFSFILVVVGLLSGNNLSKSLAVFATFSVVLFAVSIIVMIATHSDKRWGYRVEIFEGLPEQTNNFKPYCSYKHGFLKRPKELISFMQIAGVLLVTVFFTVKNSRHLFDLLRTWGY